MKEERNKNLTNSELTWLTGCCLVSHISLSWTRSQQGSPGCPLHLVLLLQEDANGFPHRAASPVKSSMRCSEFPKWRPKPNFEGSSCRLCQTSHSWIRLWPWVGVTQFPPSLSHSTDCSHFIIHPHAIVSSLRDDPYLPLHGTTPPRTEALPPASRRRDGAPDSLPSKFLNLLTLVFIPARQDFDVQSYFTCYFTFRVILRISVRLWCRRAAAPSCQMI